MSEVNLNHLRKFVAPEFIFGTGSRFVVGQYVRNLGGKKVLLVSGKNHECNVWPHKIMRLLDEASIGYVAYDNVSPNPRDYEVMQGVEVYRKNKCDLILGVGGGSPMDCAKGIGIVANNGGHILDYEGVDEVPAPIPPLICIPTTSGSSADVSQFSIILDTERKSKIAIVSKAVVPDIALIDPQTTMTMSPELTAHTGLDALTHAVEALVSNAASPITELHALKAVELIFANLIKAVNEPENLEYRTRMSMGSMLAGLAFSNASLGAVHAMSHSLGGLYDLPHGLCNAILLPYVIGYNYSSAASIYDKIFPMIGVDAGNLEENARKEVLIERIIDLSKRAGVDKKLSAFGISLDAVPSLSERAMNDACMVTNPTTPKIEDVSRVYEEAIQ